MQVLSSTTTRAMVATAAAATVVVAMVAGTATAGTSSSTSTKGHRSAVHEPDGYFHAFTGRGDFTPGRSAGVEVAPANGGQLTLARGATTGTWTSAAYRTPAPITELVSSWQADTPGKSWVQTQLSVRIDGAWSPYFITGTWALTDAAIERTSVNGQSNAFGSISTDTWFAPGEKKATAYRLREVLHGTAVDKPAVRQVGATSFDAGPAVWGASPTTMTKTVHLAVPKFSQETHHGEYAAFGGGGEAWCSPTSTAMVVDYWHRGPSAAQLASMPPDKTFDAHGRKDPLVDWAARHIYDKAYDGTGNWPFNTAYASAYGLDGSVRRYADLRGVEQWVKKGVPVVISISWDNTSSDPHRHLDGSSISGTAGHLITIVGFTKSGDVLVNDPASPGDSTVLHTYRRDQLEYNWQYASSGIVYLDKPASITG